MRFNQRNVPGGDANTARRRITLTAITNYFITVFTIRKRPTNFFSPHLGE